MEFTTEQMEKAKACETLEEFKELAKAEGLTLTEEEAEKYFNATRSGELTDEEVDSVAGGSKGWKPTGTELFKRNCPFCGTALEIKVTEYNKGEAWKYECKPNVCSCGATIKRVFGTSRLAFTKNGEIRYVW